MGTLVKICGIASADAADAAARAGADFAGLVFFRRSPRFLNPEIAASLAMRMRGRVRLVALLADANDEEISAAIAATNPDFLQLHGSETPERVAAIRTRFGRPVIKSIAIADASDFSAVPRYEAVSDVLLFDAKAPAGAQRPGGHGAAFDWQLLRNRNFTKPWLLAGGLNTENITRAIQISGAPGVDVSSGVETAPGVKSPQMIHDFVAAIRSVQFVKEEQA
jgi:phosphoribosylanthranilate isomerase